MKDIISFVYTNIDIFVTLITMIITWVLGSLAKKSTYVNNNLIIFQNIFIGMFVAVLYFVCTKDINLAIALSGVFAETGYNVLHNIQKLIESSNK